MSKPGPKKGSKKSASHKKNISNAVSGSKNPRWVNGRRSYRSIAGAKEGEVVHHKDGNRDNNKPSNLVRLKGKKKGTNTTTRHEKITKRGQGRKKGGKNSKRIGGTKVRSYKLFGTKKKK